MKKFFVRLLQLNKCCFFVKVEDKEKVKKLFFDNNIGWQDESLFKFEFKTAILTTMIIVVLIIVFTSI